MNKYAHPFIFCIRALGYSQMMSQSIHKGTGEMPVSRMHHHTGLFVKNQQIIIFIYNIQRNVFRQNLQAATLVRHHKLDHISGAHYIISLDDLVIDPYIFSLYSQLYAMTGSIFHMRGKIFIHSHRYLTGRNIEAVMFEHFLLLIFVRYLITCLN